MSKEGTIQSVKTSAKEYAAAAKTVDPTLNHPEKLLISDQFLGVAFPASNTGDHKSEAGTLPLSLEITALTSSSFGTECQNLSRATASSYSFHRRLFVECPAYPELPMFF